MKIDRLMGIVIYLLNHGRTSAQGLAKEFEVSARTIMRDLESLDQAGIPIQSFMGVDGGYQILENYVLDKQTMTKHEYDWIVTALRGASSAYNNKELSQALAKMDNLKDSDQNVVSIDIGVAKEDKRVSKWLPILEDAIKQKRLVRFNYVNSLDEEKQIQVEPVQIQYKWYNWYLYGYYEKHQDYCMFKLVRMEDVEMTKQSFTGPRDVQKMDTLQKEQETTKIVLYGEKSIKSRCREYLNGEVTREYENGDFEFCFCVPEHEYFWFGVVLSFGNKAKILSPDRIKQRITQTCKQIEDLYR